MAGKGRRAAARQGELSRRRKRNQRGPSGAPAAQHLTPQDAAPGSALATAVAADSTVEEGEAQRPQSASAMSPSQAPRVAAQAAPQPRGQGRMRGERPAAYNYVGAELRRIVILSTAVLAALIVISVVL